MISKKKSGKKSVPAPFRWRQKKRNKLNKEGAKINPAQEAQKARNYAFYLLKFRLRSEKEVADRLKKKQFDSEAIAQTLAFLKEKRFLDDAEFARAWMETRIKRPLGLRRLRQELKLKGIAPSIIESNVARIKKDYSEEAVVSGIARERFAKLKAIEPQKARQRIFAYLIRRGFSSDTVMDAINNL
jgi:regulatory protein